MSSGLTLEELAFLHRLIGRTDITAFSEEDFLLAMRLYKRLGDERIPTNGGQFCEQKDA